MTYLPCPLRLDLFRMIEIHELCNCSLLPKKVGSLVSVPPRSKGIYVSIQA